MLRKKRSRPAGDAAGQPAPFRSDLERRIYELIVEFPDRIDEMETRNEENSRDLAGRISRLVEEEMRRQGTGG